MHRTPASAITILVALLLALRPGLAAIPSVASGPSLLCRAATAGAEQSSRIPDQLLSAISKVESGRYDAASGLVQAWPWTINAEGVGHYYESKAEAIAAAQAFQAQGIRSIDVGCMQVNLSYHPTAFSSLDQAFDPQANAVYAASFLLQLFQQQGSWPHAAAAYHSLNPGPGGEYQKRVLDVWATPDRPSGSRVASAPARAVPAIAESVVTAGAAPPVTMGGAHIIRLAGATGMNLATGRGLDAYRNAPVPMILRPFRSN